MKMGLGLVLGLKLGLGLELGFGFGLRLGVELRLAPPSSHTPLFRVGQPVALRSHL